MEIELLKITPIIKTHRIYAYFDILIKDIGLRIKGMRIFLKNNEMVISFPSLPIEGVKHRFIPVLFEDDEKNKEIRAKCKELVMKEYPISKWGDGVYVNKNYQPKGTNGTKGTS